jgi:signal transduction histidine kinase
MNNAKTQTESAIQTLSRLTGGLAHEIRNPLSTLKMNVQLLQEDLRELPADAPAVGRSLRRAETMKAEIDRLSNILDGFLRFVTRHEPNLQAIDLNAVIRQSVDFFEPQASAQNVQLATVLADGPLTARIDADRIKQAVFNLLLNAVQAMPTGGDLTVRTRRSDTGRLQIVVADTGTGIAAEHRERIFDAYYSTKKGGSGLGLAMTARIVDEHNGTIDVQSTVGSGTTFTIELPQADTIDQRVHSNRTPDNRHLRES